MCKENQITIEELQNSILNCRKCHLCPNSVPGTGDPNAKIMLVGEAPGENEAAIQIPFVGAAGQLLNQILENAGLDREKLYITNTVKGRPFEGNKNRAPNEEEIKVCRIWLWKEIQIVKPQIIGTLGKVPTYTLLHSLIKKTFLMKNVVGLKYTVDYYTYGIFIPVYHPSYLLQHGKHQIKQCVNILSSFKDMIK